MNDIHNQSEIRYVATHRKFSFMESLRYFLRGNFRWLKGVSTYEAVKRGDPRFETAPFVVNYIAHPNAQTVFQR